jgi:hypothetical protein
MWFSNFFENELVTHLCARADSANRVRNAGYLKDILSRLPTQPYSQIGELLPHCWQPESR